MRIPKKDENKATFDLIEKNFRTFTNSKGKIVTNKRWRASFAFKKTDGTWEGERKNFPSREEAEDWIEDEKAEYTIRGVQMEHRGLLFHTYAELVYKPNCLFRVTESGEEIFKIKSGKSEARYVDAAVGYFDRISPKRLDGFDRDNDLKPYKEWLEYGDDVKMTDGKPVRIRGERSVNGYMMRLRAVLNEAREGDKILKVPSFKGLILSELPSREVTISPDRHRLLLDACDVVQGGHDRSNLKPILIGLRELGCRQIELHWIQVSNIDLEKNVVSVRPAKRGDNPKPRFTPITPELRQFIEDHQVMELPSDVLVFGERWDTKKAWATAKKIAGLEKEDIHLHDYRHTAITNAHEAGVRDADLKKWYGHSTKSKVTDGYINQSPGYMQNEMEKVDAHRLEQDRISLRRERLALEKERSEFEKEKHLLFG